MSKNLYDESSGPQSFCQTSSAPPASFPEAKEAMTSEAKAAHNLAGVMPALTLCSAKRCIFSGKRPYFMVWASHLTCQVREEFAVLKQLDHPHVLRIFEARSCSGHSNVKLLGNAVRSTISYCTDLPHSMNLAKNRHAIVA